MRRLLVLALLMLACSSGPPHPCGGSSNGMTLGQLAKRRDLHFGAFTFTGTGDAAFQAAFSELEMITLPVFMQRAETAPDQFDFSLPDSVAAAAPPGSVFYVPGLIANEVKLLPSWLPGDYDGAQLKTFMVNFVTAAVQHFETRYPGRVIAYEVVLEPLSYQGQTGVWHRIGLDAGLDQYEYIRVAFAAARAAAPHTKLYIDDFGTEDGSAKSDELFDLVTKLHSDGAPIDGVGLECHYMIDPGGAFPDLPPTSALIANMDRLAKSGFDTMITSADISMHDSNVTADNLAKQAQRYQSLVHACLSSARCKAFSTWGIGDSDTWITSAHMGWGSPLLFDTSWARKPAYDAVASELRTGCSP